MGTRINTKRNNKPQTKNKENAHAKQEVQKRNHAMENGRKGTIETPSNETRITQKKVGNISKSWTPEIAFSQTQIKKSAIK